MLGMLQQLITSLAGRSAAKDTTRLQAVEIEELLESVPQVAIKLRNRQLNDSSQPRSVCTSLKDICEL